jgi:hypothetical protein
MLVTIHFNGLMRRSIGEGVAVTRRRGCGLALAVVTAGLASLGVLAVNAASATPPVWPEWSAGLPVAPLAAAAVLLAASAAVAVTTVWWAMPRRGWQLLVSAVLAGGVAFVAGAASLAINVATASPPAWPNWLAWVPSPPVPVPRPAPRVRRSRPQGFSQVGAAPVVSLPACLPHTPPQPPTAH